MLHLFDRATMARAFELDLDPRLRTLLTSRISALDTDLIDWTEYLIVEPGDGEDDIIQCIGFSPMVDPISGIRFDDDGFQPCWEHLIRHLGWFEMIVTFGSTFACILFISDEEGAPPALRALCEQHV